MIRSNVSMTRLFVGNIPKDLNPSVVKISMQELLCKSISGNVKISVYPMGDATDKNRGFAFIDFDDYESAKKGMDLIGGMKIGSRFLTSDWAEKEPEIDESIMKNVKKLYARNLPPGTTSHQLTQWMECDKITHVKIMGNYAFVHFSSRDEAERILREKNGLILKDNEIELTWAKPIGQKRSATSPIFLNSPLIPFNNNSSSPLIPFTTVHPFTPISFTNNNSLQFRTSSLLVPSPVNQLDLFCDSSILDRIASNLSQYSLFYFIPQSPVIHLAQKLMSKNLHNVIYQTTVTYMNNLRHYTTQGTLPTGKYVSSLPCLSPYDSITMAAQYSLLSLIHDGIILSSEITYTAPSLPLPLPLPHQQNI
uniref:RNA binding protein n=1 Tax=Pristionchus pacificus TaxID=54126 RepID=A0A8R1UR58_PRIPA